MTFGEWLWTDAPPAWLAVVGTAVAIVYASRAYVRERRRDVEEQASNVAVWPHKTYPGQGAFGLANTSSGPVWNVVIYAYSWRKMGPRYVLWPYGAFDIGVTPPHASPRYFKIDLNFPGDHVDSGYGYAMRFRDSKNRYWYRTNEGELRRGDHPDHDKFGEPRRTSSPAHGELE